MSKKYIKVISLLLCLAMIASVFSVYVSADSGPKSGNYYVQYNGSGDGRSVSSPAGSILEAVKSVNADGLTTGDTANIYVIAPVVGYSAGADSHTVCPWERNSSERQVFHNAKIVVQAYDYATGGRQSVAYSSRNDTTMILGGPTEFKHVNLFSPSASDGADAKYIWAYGFDLTFGEDIVYYRKTSSSGGFTKTTAPCVATSQYQLDQSSQIVQNSQTITYASGAYGNQELNIPTYNYADYNAYNKEDFNLVLNNAGIGNNINEVFKIRFGGNHENNTTYSFKKNFNIDIENASFVGFLNAKGNQKIHVDGGLQIIAKSGVQYRGGDWQVYSTAGEAIRTVTSITNTSIWSLTVSTTGLLSYTSTAGTFAVSSGYSATATNTTTGQVIESSDGLLTVPAGDYNVTVGTDPVSRNYYAKYKGSGDGRSVSSPAGSILEAVKSANADGLKAGDTANIYVLAPDNGDTVSSSSHTVCPWERNSNERQVVHTAKIVVQGYEGVNQFVAYSERTGVTLLLSGPTEFRNINLFSPTTKGTPKYIFALGNSVTFGSGTKFYVINDNNNGFLRCQAPYLSTSTYKIESSDSIINKVQTVTYDCACTLSGTSIENIGELNIPTYFYANSNAYNSQDFNLVLNNAEIGHSENNPLKIRFGGDNENSTTYPFKKNFNISINNAGYVAFLGVKAGSNQKITVNGGLQVMAKPGVVYRGGDWKVYNNVGSAIRTVSSIVNTSIWGLTVAEQDKISFTPTAGSYLIADGYVGHAIDTNSNQYISENGILTIPAGDYTIWFTEEANTEYSDYIFNRGSGLQNTYSKLTTGDKKLNVVYFGGSVTEGYGGPGFDASKCWRNLSGAWLKNTFPEATINTINCACGESGTLLGSYRLNKDVLSQNPDLIFLEYSINDKYDNATYERASYQFETIVREIKESFPTCDIITVLVTDYDKADQARKANGSKLHLQAQAHEDICKVYNIPSLHVGCALADLLPGGFTYDQWKTICGAYDTVHLKEGGNEVYFNVIKEYLNSQLVYGEYDGTTASYNLPEVQNSHLLNGNITYIQPSQELVTRSIELGGSGVSYKHDTAFPLRGYDDLFNFWYGDVDHTLVVEFNGTELIGLLHNYNSTRNGASNRTYDISIDGGEYTTHNFYHMNPTVFATGLEAGDHVAKIKVDVKDSDNWLWIGALFSRDETRQTVKGSEYTSALINSNFNVECADIKDSDDLGLRFVFNLNKSFLDELPEVIEYGAITLPTDTAEGKEMFLDTPIVKEWQWDSETKSNFTPLTTGATPSKVVAKNILEENANQIKYTLCLTDVDETKYDTFYSVRGYIKYKNAKNEVKVVYTENFQSSVYKVAAETASEQKTNIENAVVNYVEVDRVENYFETNTVKQYYCGYEGCTDTNPNHKIYILENNLLVREANLTGFANTEKTEIVFMTDPHFNYIDEQDLLDKNANVLSSYRGRTWLRDGSQLSNVKKAMQYASMFKKTVMGGDAVDYLSNGSMEMTQRLLTNKSVNGSIKMVLGNHETMETCQADTTGLTNKYTLAQRNAMVQNYWTNNVNFDYEILKKNDGVTDNLMLIYLDDSTKSYTAAQLAQLESAFALARTKNVPVIIFQHSAMRTWNQNEQTVYFMSDRGTAADKTSFGTESTGSYYCDFYLGKYKNSNYFTGANENDTVTQQVCTLIRKNYDIVKGLICGDEHAHAYTEIVGLNADGSIATDNNGNAYVIPQHIQYGVHYNGVMKITIE